MRLRLKMTTTKMTTTTTTDDDDDDDDDEDMRLRLKRTTTKMTTTATTDDDDDDDDEDKSNDDKDDDDDDQRRRRRRRCGETARRQIYSSVWRCGDGLHARKKLDTSKSQQDDVEKELSTLGVDKRLLRRLLAVARTAQGCLEDGFDFACVSKNGLTNANSTL